MENLVYYLGKFDMPGVILICPNGLWDYYVELCKYYVDL
jgi:hypothetical protein